ncbi:sorbitol-6-phosphate dehydrogenase [Clostridium botulinum]|nr:sorbitol-6-phosphate dehydrogenase [Clostridium botulinum]NFD33389.1 sorbitol-6-phosphate dehydrogenase [Clostridium botulinum]NFD61122.1 sorbitol-6-phosphate dehydrogenase [Clostridium botulinum]NFE02852.1 sorbitol-6-phosphate dehydrogenase [Clostridium botulinum]
MNFKEKTVIITGGAQSLGEYIAYSFAEKGANIVIADINYEQANKVSQNIINKYKVRSIAVKVDVCKEEEVKNLIKNTIDNFSKIDILICNAGVVYSTKVTELPKEKWDNILNVNLTGYFLCAKEAAKEMVKRKQGVIIDINSKSGKKGSLHNCAYSASKFGAIGLTQSLALDLAEDGIRVNAVCPGNLLDSPMWKNGLYEQYAKKLNIPKEKVRQAYIDKIPLKRGCTYEDVSNLVLFLSSKEASYMTGQAVNVTGGQEMR